MAAATAQRLTLYTNPLAFNPAKPVFVIHEKNLTNVKIQPVNVFTGESLQPWFMKLNPNSTVPTLVHDGKVLCESLEISRYLDNLDGQPLGGQQVDRALVEELVKEIDAFDGNLYAFTKTPASALGLLATIRQYRTKVAEARARENPDLAPIYNAKISSMQATSAETKDTAKVEANEAKLTALLDRAEQLLGSGEGKQPDGGEGPFLAGPAVSLADTMMAAVLYRVHMLGQYQKEVAPRPAVRAYLQRMRARPAWAKTFGPGDSTGAKLSWILPAVLKAKVLGLFGVY